MAVRGEAAGEPVEGGLPAGRGGPEGRAEAEEGALDDPVFGIGEEAFELLGGLAGHAVGRGQVLDDLVTHPESGERGLHDPASRCLASRRRVNSAWAAVISATLSAL